jgi:prepilin-type N-terminal cleavage/methylation domain-containing protein
MCEQAFTLIEMIGVIAIMAILAAVIAPNVVKQMQAAGQDAEEEALDVLAEGLIDYVLENRIIPQSDEGSGTWSTNIATQTDLPTENIYENDLGNSRRYWFDPATDLNGLSDNSASYNQNTVSAANLSGDATTSTASAPTNPRAMIISDLTSGGTNNILVASVAHNAANFAAAWDQTGTLTESSTLKIKRINFASLFKTVTLQSANGSIISERSYNNPPAGTNTINPVMSVEKNSHIYSVSYSSGGFEPTNLPGGTALLDIGYTPGGNEFVSTANVISGVTSGPVAVTYTSTGNISISSELTIGGAGVVNGNSGNIDITVEHNGEPQYKLEGQAGDATTISITTPGSPEIVSFNVIDGTTIYLYDQSWTVLVPTGNLLHSVVIKESEGFTYLPGPPASWIR